MLKKQIPFVLATALAVSYGILFLLALFWQKPIVLVGQIGLGFDYSIFHRASRVMMSGYDPYVIDGLYVAPPLAAFINMPLAMLSRAAATGVFFVVNAVIALFCTYALSARAGILGARRLAMLFVALFCAPTMMLVERGNIDGIVLLFLTLWYLLWDRQILSGIALGVAAAVKVYPLVVLPGLLGAKRFRSFAVALGVAVVSTGAMYVVWPELVISFFERSSDRTAWTRLNENISSANLFIQAMDEPSDGLIRSGLGGIRIYMYKAMIAAFLGLGVFWDFKKARAGEIAKNRGKVLAVSYLAFAVNVPSLVFLYCGVVVLLILLSALDRKASVGPVSLSLLMAASFLIFFPARSFEITLNHIPFIKLVDFVPEIGGLVLLLYFMALRLEGRGQELKIKKDSRCFE